MVFDMDATPLELTTAHQLPGHQSGRDLLIAALHGEASTPCRVLGGYVDDQFVVTDIVDVFDPEQDCWASEYGFDSIAVA